MVYFRASKPSIESKYSNKGLFYLINIAYKIKLKIPRLSKWRESARTDTPSVSPHQSLSRHDLVEGAAAKPRQGARCWVVISLEFWGDYEYSRWAFGFHIWLGLCRLALGVVPTYERWLLAFGILADRRLEFSLFHSCVVSRGQAGDECMPKLTDSLGLSCGTALPSWRIAL